MPAQHKRPGRRAREDRISRAKEREAEKQRFKVVVGYPRRGQARDEINVGRLVIWAEVVEIAKGKKEKRTIPTASGIGSGREGYARQERSPGTAHCLGSRGGALVTRKEEP